MSFSRRRVPVACTLCRKRKRRCDAHKPTCGFCQELEAECHYDVGPVESVRPLDDVEVRESLQRIESLLQENLIPLKDSLQSKHAADLSVSKDRSIAVAVTSRAHASTTPTQSQLAFPSSYNSDLGSTPQNELHAQQTEDIVPALTIPVKHSTSSNSLLSLPTIRQMIGHYPDDYFYRLEVASNLPSTTLFSRNASTNGDGAIDLSKEKTDMLVTSYFSSVHCHYPLLNVTMFESSYFRAQASSYSAGNEKNLCFTVFALGSLTVDASTADGLRWPGWTYLQDVLPDLIISSTWGVFHDLATVQALLLANIYFAYVARPLNSWRLLSMAATNIQLQLPRPDNDTLDHVTKEVLVRCYWTCFMMESDRLAELDVPQSGLQSLVDTMPLPSFCAGFDDEESIYHLAEISIRRLLNRVHNSIYPRKSTWDAFGGRISNIEQLKRLDTVCQELHHQLDAWITSIPEHYRPNIWAIEADLKHHRQRILRIRYLAALHIIYRPFILHVVASANNQVPLVDDSAWIIGNCRICIESCRVYLRNATAMLAAPTPYAWTFAISSLGAVLVLTMACQCQQLYEHVPDLIELQDLAINSISQCVERLKLCSGAEASTAYNESSLEAAVEILRQVKRKSRIQSLLRSDHR